MYLFDFSPVFSRMDILLAGAWVTLRFSFIAMLLGGIVSLVCAIAKVSGPRPIKWAVDAYIEIIRNTPFLVQIFFIYFGLPSVGFRIGPNEAAILALVINVGAYGTEIIRAGIDAIPRGQVEAGLALGLKRMQIYRDIVIKQAFRTIYPALSSQFIHVILQSSVVSAISASDLSHAGKEIDAMTFASFEIYIVITFIYLVMSLGFSSLFAVIHRLAFRYPLAR